MNHRYTYKQIAVGIRTTVKPTLGSAFSLMTAPLYEPEKRNHDGVRYHRHRFPIVGGISHIEVLQRQMAEENAILRYFSSEDAGESL